MRYRNTGHSIRMHNRRVHTYTTADGAHLLLELVSVVRDADNKRHRQIVAVTLPRESAQAVIALLIQSLAVDDRADACAAIAEGLK